MCVGRIQPSSPSFREEDKGREGAVSQEGDCDAEESEESGDVLEACLEYPWADRGSVCERGRPGVTWQGCRGEIWKLTHRRNRRVGQSWRTHWETVGNGAG